MDFKKIKAVISNAAACSVFIDNNEDFYDVARTYGIQVIYYGDYSLLNNINFFDDDEFEQLFKICDEDSNHIHTLIINIMEKHFDEDFMEYAEYLSYAELYNLSPSLFDEANKKLMDISDYTYDYEFFIKDGILYSTLTDLKYTSMVNQYKLYCLDSTIKALEANMTPKEKEDTIKMLKKKYKSLV